MYITNRIDSTRFNDALGSIKGTFDLILLEKDMSIMQAKYRGYKRSAIITKRMRTDVDGICITIRSTDSFRDCLERMLFISSIEYWSREDELHNTEELCVPIYSMKDVKRVVSILDEWFSKFHMNTYNPITYLIPTIGWTTP